MNRRITEKKQKGVHTRTLHEKPVICKRRVGNGQLQRHVLLFSGLVQSELCVGLCTWNLWEDQLREMV